jgi:hypothetical protein
MLFLKGDEPIKNPEVSIMLNWISGLTSDGRLDGPMHNAEAAVKALGIQWFAADHEAKLACGQLVIEAIQKLIPNYDLSRNLYSQFFFFATHQSTTDLEEDAKWFSETAAAAKDEDPPLFIAMSSIGQLFSLYAINAAAKGEKTRQASGTLYTTHSRTVNDMIQYVLYHRAFQS